MKLPKPAWSQEQVYLGHDEWLHLYIYLYLQTLPPPMTNSAAGYTLDDG
jgi:chloramphenicol 3-O-phosphotransferase